MTNIKRIHTLTKEEKKMFIEEEVKISTDKSNRKAKLKSLIKKELMI